MFLLKSKKHFQAPLSFAECLKIIPPRLFFPYLPMKTIFQSFIFSHTKLRKQCRSISKRIPSPDGRSKCLLPAIALSFSKAEIYYRWIHMDIYIHTTLRFVSEIRLVMHVPHFKHPGSSFTCKASNSSLPQSRSLPVRNPQASQFCSTASFLFLCTHFFKGARYAALGADRKWERILKARITYFFTPVLALT